MSGARNRGIVFGLAAAFWGLGLAPAPAQAPAAPDDSALVARGEYLARAADCMPCHTGDKNKPFAGGLGLNTPFGTIYSVNITSDAATGIGSWTFDDFRRALHDGIRKDGAYLYPAMPFDAYTGITEDDLKALWAYVRRIPAVDAPNPENGLSFPSTSAWACWPGANCSSSRPPSSRRRARATNGTAAPIWSRRSAIARTATARATSWARSRARRPSPAPRSTASTPPTSPPARWARPGARTC